jgi:hypothetical protein
LNHAKGKHFESTLENASSAPAAKVILQAITSGNPELRYTIGAATIIQARMNMHDQHSMTGTVILVWLTYAHLNLWN